MTRPLRIESADTFYHVLSRGNEGRRIFQTDRDYLRFLELLGEFSERFEIEVWSYVLMINHYHLLLRTRQANLSRAMQWLGVAYSTWFNAKHRRIGHLFQGRFKSFLIEEEDYLVRLLLYIHRNPVRAGLVERLAQYRWSSYVSLAYDRKEPDWLHRKAVLAFFDDDSATFRREVKGYSEEDDRLLENLWHGVALGSATGIRRVLTKNKEQTSEEKPDLGALAQKRTIEQATEQLTRIMKLRADQVNHWRVGTYRRVRTERDILIALLCRLGSFSMREIAGFFNVTSAAVTYAGRRGERALLGRKGLGRKVQRAFNLKFKM